MPTAIICSSDPFESMTWTNVLLRDIVQRRSEAQMPDRHRRHGGVALIICDALRDYTSYRFTNRVCRIIARLRSLNFDPYYDIIPAMIFWPDDVNLPRVRTLRCQRVTADLIQRACVVVVCGGNVHALLQSFAVVDALLVQLRSVLQDNLCLLLAWSAGSTASGPSAEHTKDRYNQLQLRTRRPRITRGLNLIPYYSFAPHVRRARVDNWLRWWRRQHRQFYDGFLVTLPDGTFVVFRQSDHPIDWNSEDIGWLDTRLEYLN